MMTLRAGRRALLLGFTVALGAGASALPAAAQSYLADNGSGGVTVDYSVLGGAPGAPAAAPVGSVSRAALPQGSCSCANAPLGVITAAPRPTFTNPFGNAQMAQAPAVPAGFMTYAQAVGSAQGTGERVVLRAPEPAAIEDSTTAALPANTPASQPAAEPTETAQLPATTPTQSGAATQPTTEPTTQPASTADANAPAQPDQMPASVPSPVDQTQQQAAAAAPAPAETPAPAAAPAPTPAPDANAAPADQTATPANNTQTAAVAPAAPADGTATPPASGGALPAGAFRLLYSGESDDVPADATAQLDELAKKMAADENVRVQVMAYAAGTEDTESKARRKSLARGLAIRSYLIKAGVRSTRIDVRALGSKADGGPADRVDIVSAS
jgi:outer membrane protein OmpA-like peptidoglycan-associated protein